MTFDRRGRHLARRALSQALYQWRLNPCEAQTLIDQYVEDPLYRRMDATYFQEQLKGTLEACEAIDAMIEPVVSRPFEKLTPMELSILRSATYELMTNLDVPFKVIIKEALLVAQAFAATDASKFIHGVLDVLAHDLRAGEADLR